MLTAGATASLRTALAERSGVAEPVIRLYHDAGVDTLEKLAAWEPEALLEMVIDFVDRTRFEGIAPFPAEVRFSIAKAKQLPKIVEL